MIVGPVDWILSAIALFRTGLYRLVDDYRISLRVREAERTSQFLRRRVRREHGDRVRRRRRVEGGVRRCTVMLRRVDREDGTTTDDHPRLLYLPSPARGSDDSITSSSSHTTMTTTRDDDDDRASDMRRRRRHPPYLVDLPYARRRRLREHLRRTMVDLSVALPTAAAFVLVPFVGYAFVFLGMAFPRLLLSRQFHTRNQRIDFGMEEYARRRGWYEVLSNGDFWGCCMRNVPDLVLLRRGGEEEEEEEEIIGEVEDQGDYCDTTPPEFLGSLSYLEMDTAGPVLGDRSMRTLYDLIRRNVGRRDGSSSSDSSSFDDGGESSSSAAIGNLQPSHLHHLALSNNLASSLLLPPALAPAFLQICFPSAYLRRRLTLLAEDVIMDDAALIEEGHLPRAGGGDGCVIVGMTDEEVFDACWLRGLPLGRFAAIGGVGCDGEEEAFAARRVLANHLRMMEAVMSARRCGPSITMTRRKGTVSKDDEVKIISECSLRPRGELVRDNALHLLILHLPAIRYGLMRKNNSFVA